MTSANPFVGMLIGAGWEETGTLGEDRAFVVRIRLDSPAAWPMEAVWQTWPVTVSRAETLSPTPDEVIKERGGRRPDGPSLSDLREEVAYWRRDLEARLWSLTARYSALKAEGRVDAAVMLGLELRSALASYDDAKGGEWHDRCDACGEFVLPGEPRAGDDEISGHARCLSPLEAPAEPDPDDDLDARAAAARAALAEPFPQPEAAAPIVDATSGGEAPGRDDGWQPIETAPTDKPYTADMPDEADGDGMGWAISGDDDRLLFLVWWEQEAAARWTVTKWHPLPSAPRPSQREG